MRCPTLNELPPPPPGKKGWPWTAESTQLPDTMADGLPWPKISIITPSLNQGQFIEETIRSVLLQGYPNLEYLIIDGGSTDESIQIIKKYQKWLSYWISEPDNGQANAINKGFKKASGDIVAWLNSDDYYEKKSLMHIAREFNDSHYGFVYGDTRIVDEFGHTLSFFLAREFSYKDELFHNHVPQQSCFWRRSVFADSGYLDESYHFTMDYDFWIRCGLKEKFKYVPILLANSRWHRDAKSATQSIKFGQESLKIFQSLFASNALPNHLMRYKNRIMQNKYERLAKDYLASNLKREARYHFIKAICANPLRIQNLTLFLYFLDTLLSTNYGYSLQSLRKKCGL
ncbi:MAG: glycosyltransferase family 2 protein [Candidatus Pacebacteria bacterium]|nr:glycosyltransferase family 2 protein [Candidatus Paceibacterota bacterium]